MKSLLRTLDKRKGEGWKELRVKEQDVWVYGAVCQIKLRTVEDHDNPKDDSCTHPPEHHRRGANQYASWVKCMQCGKRISYVAKTNQQRRQGKADEVTITETRKKVRCRKCQQRIPCGTRAALSGVAWRHLECLENEPTAAAGAPDVGPGDIKGWRMPPGGSALCKVCQGPFWQTRWSPMS